MVILARVLCLCAVVQADRLLLILQLSAHISLSVLAFQTRLGAYLFTAFLKLYGDLPVFLSRWSSARAELSHLPLCP